MELSEVDADVGAEREQVAVALDQVRRGLAQSPEDGPQPVSPGGRLDLGPQRLDRLLGVDPTAADGHQLEQLLRLPAPSGSARPPRVSSNRPSTASATGSEEASSARAAGEPGLDRQRQQRLGHLAFPDQRQLGLPQPCRLLEGAGWRARPPTSSPRRSAA